MRQFLKFLAKIKSFWKLYRDYEYDGEDIDFIMRQYQDVLGIRTKLMSKPTYYAKDIIRQIDDWYEEMYERLYREKMAVIKSTDNKLENRFDFSVLYADCVDTDVLLEIVIEKVRDEVRNIG